MQKIVIQTHSAAETMQLAEQMGSLLQAGDASPILAVWVLEKPRLPVA